jgi:MFS family permease
MSASTDVNVKKVLSGLGLGMFLAALDQTVTSTASLTISQHFHKVADQSWLMTIYIAASLLTTPIYGRLSDSFGRRRLFIAGLALFGAGSLVAAAAQGYWLLIAARGLQGLGAGGLFSLAFAVIADLVPVKERGRYILLFVLIFGSASILGPLLGGVIASQSSIAGIAGWRWIFIFNLPFVLAAIYQSAKHLPSVKHKVFGSFDWLGTLAFTVVIALVLAIAQLSRLGTLISLRTSLIVVLVIAVLGFGFAEKIKKSDALFPIEFFKHRGFLLTILTSAVASGAMLIALTVNPLSIQIVQHRSPVVAGLVLLAMGFGNLFGSGYANRVFAKDGSHRLLGAIGSIFMAGGFIPMFASPSIVSISFGLFILGIGSGLINQFTSATAPSMLGSEHRGAASAINTLVRQVGGLFGVSLAMATIFYFWKVPASFTVSTLSAAQRSAFINAAKPAYFASALTLVVMALLARAIPKISNSQLVED